MCLNHNAPRLTDRDAEVQGSCAAPVRARPKRHTKADWRSTLFDSSTHGYTPTGTTEDGFGAELQVVGQGRMVRQVCCTYVHTRTRTGN